MTANRSLEAYLFERAGDDDEEAWVLGGLIRPGHPQPIFALVAALAARRDVASLELLHSGSAPLHDIIADAEDFRRDAGFADCAGPPSEPLRMRRCMRPVRWPGSDLP